MSKDMLSTRNVYFSYRTEDSEKLVLNDVSVSIKEGEFVVILGHNGSGKSTLAKHFNAILLPKDGDVFVEELNTKEENSIWNIRQKAGMVFQNPDNQIVATIVEEDVAFGPENLGVPPEEIRVRVDEALTAVNMIDYKEHGPHLLSGGQKQRVAIAGVLAMKPRCIILDEPTAMLDPSGRREVISTIKKLNREENITIVLITHYMEEAAQADRIIVMDSGNPIIEGTPREVFKEVEKLKTIGLDVPQMTELSYKLRQSGVALKEDILTIEEMVDEICRLK
ncbi:energy-coupling factor transporter ATPase [Clostridium cylindrosporum]|uniref:Energy-coupling factor transporter ATP-binding protein EcfA1 n=1 Tax=Clostridium cylindrosporum DSM 605 TaxID=1121307 RepID=A0A0J8D4X0_CLOCY|nr:energy-coupling factor transporter ATPase [Clostridium cylindrosporum]KMT21210.1 energy-coupling factor transporter ATP-binding protein EcfA1 [Clostridium cylindrosporum DSM 605]